MPGPRAWLDGTLRTICVSLFAWLVLLLAWQVFTRLVLGQPSAWTEEAARHTFVWVSLIGIAIAVGEKADVVMDILVERLPLPLQRGADLVAYLATLMFVLYVMVYGGFQQSALAWGQQNPLLPLTQGQLYLALPVSGVLLTIYLVIHVIGTFLPGYKGHVGADEDLEAAAL
ncbi:TRAP transporter small permease [Arthrobacter gandavensis]|uniref:TRAP transporter small permease n=1 Tax=Arthrobacter gandavensis TaxID=169960 RepID=UPI00188E47DA|nr:TRAP transporter small permease [Arthrobacter gandavensis]MBF4992743.1 TRAP transporter small permease [Arthrobacter gandavensis]